MWTKIVTVKFDKHPTNVMVFLAGESEDNEALVEIRSMVNEYFLEEEIKFPDRDGAYDFIKLFTNPMATAFLNRTAYNAGAMDK